MAKTDIWMPVYIGDYLKDTQHLTPQQHGIYFLLMLHYWQKGMLQASFKQCSSITKAYAQEEQADLKFVLDEFFQMQDDRYIQKRIDVELSKAKGKKEVYQERAKKAADKRWKDASSNASSNSQAMLGRCPSPSPSPTHKKIIKNIYGEFLNVKLTGEEFLKLEERFGSSGNRERIENLSSYLASKGDKYKSHYATILQWEKKNGKEIGKAVPGKVKGAIDYEKYAKD